MAKIKTRQAAGAALAAVTLLALAACSDPGATAATAPSSGSTASAAGKTFNLAPEQNRVKVAVDAKAAALVPDAIKADGKLTVVTTRRHGPAEPVRHRQQNAHRQRSGHRLRRRRDTGADRGGAPRGLGRLAAGR